MAAREPATSAPLSSLHPDQEPCMNTAQTVRSAAHADLIDRYFDA